jgi:methionyl-tRNA formyltransferase
MKSKKIIFFGSGQLGLDALTKLKSEFEVSLVITKNKPPKHKGAMPVYDYCVDNGLNFATPASKSELDYHLETFFDSHQDLELGVVVDYGIIISENSIFKFKLGILNSHFSLLPSWRGADPITFPLLAGQNQTGVTFMMIDPGMDTGQIVETYHLDILEEDDQLSLTEKLSDLSCSKINSVVNNLFDHTLRPEPQPNKLITYSRMLAKQESVLNLSKPASLLAREIQALKAWPKLKLNINGIDCIIKNGYATNVPDGSAEHGDIKFSNEVIRVFCGRKSCLNITELQPAGKRTMSSADFIRGYINK